VIDPTLAAVLAGLVTSVAAGKALVRLLALVPETRRHLVEWALIVGAALAAIAGSLISPGPVGRLVFAFVVATLPGTVAYLAWRMALATAVISLLPVYFFIGALLAGRTLHAPAIALDRAIPLVPAWIVVYGSMYVFVLLPLILIRDRRLFHRALQSYLFVLVVAYVGFLAYPTITPRPGVVTGGGLAAWALRLNYALDTRYNCFPCLHVAHSFVSALSAYRVHRRVGMAAAVWAALIGVSTLFTKQHYVVDVIAGTAMAVAAYALFLRRFPRDLVAEVDRVRAPRRALVVVAIYVLFAAGVWGLYESGMSGA
jgi:membrane-associated phospholipid phosphatase